MGDSVGIIKESVDNIREVIRIMNRTENSLDSKQVLSVIERYNTALELLDDYDCRIQT